MIGEQIGNFKIISQLGKGGMGEVYLGEHEKIGTRVAIKMLLPHVSANKELVDRFFNEAIAVGKIQHAGTGKIFDVGHHATGRAYLVMEFLGGETLAARIRRQRRLPIAEAGEIGKQISGVLEAVHKAGITHRDLKPDNIFIVPDDELACGERVKIVDFGIAKLSGVGGGVTATASGAMGTPAYMSPEQWKNTKNVDWRADAYSLGCLAFEMVAGRPPFSAETIGEACSKHLTEEPPRLASVVAAPPQLDQLIASLLSKAPEQRPPSMRDIANAFAAIAANANPLLATQLSGQIAIGHTLPAGQPPAMPSTSPNAATQASIAPIAPNAPTHVAPVPMSMSTPAIPMHVATVNAESPKPLVPTVSAESPKAVTTLGGAAGVMPPQPTAPPGPSQRGLIIAAGALAVVGIAVVIAFGMRGGGKGKKRDNPEQGSGERISLAASVECDDATERWKCLVEAAGRVQEPAIAHALYGEALAACNTDQSCPETKRAQILGWRDAEAAKIPKGQVLGVERTIIEEGSAATVVSQGGGNTASRTGSAVGSSATSPPSGSGTSAGSGFAERPEPTRFGFLSVQASVKASVHVDGRKLGDTPLTRVPLTPGPHDLRVTGNGIDYTKKIEIESEKNLPIHVEALVGNKGGDTVVGNRAPPLTTCDEVSCLLAEYANPCCAKYNRPKPKPVPQGELLESLGRTEIQEGMAKIRGKVDACVREAPAGMSGTVKVQVKIKPDGSVEAATAVATPQPELGACVVRAVKTARFAKSRNGINASYPFNLKN